MCGIAGLFLKDKSLEPELGAMLSDMLVTLTDRGPDSAGIAIHGATAANHVHNLEPEDVCVLTIEAAAMARVPPAGTDWIPGRAAF